MREEREPRRLLQQVDKEGRSVTVERRRVTYDFPLHWHDYYEIELVLSGKGTHFLNGRTHPLTRGDVTLLNPSDFHQVQVEEELEIINVSFEESLIRPQLLERFLQERSHIHIRLTEKVVSELTVLLHLLQEELSREKPYRELLVRNLLESVFVLLLRHLPERKEKMSMQKEPLQRALLFLHGHFRENPSLSAAASVAGLTPNYFSEQFHRGTGKTFKEYLCDLKLSHAKKLLDTSSLSVTEICYASGFQSLSHFLRLFQKSVHCTPSQWRRR